MSSRGNMISTTLNVLIDTMYTIDTEPKRPVHEVNYCIAMSICDKCPDDGSCDDCLPVHTFSGLGGQNALEEFWKFKFSRKKIHTNAAFMCLVFMYNSNMSSKWPGSFKYLIAEITFRNHVWIK